MKKILLSLFFASLIFLSSCSYITGVELSRRLIIEAIGIDKKDGVIAVTLQALDTHSAGIGSDASSGGDLVKLYVFTGQSVGEALAQVQSTTGLMPLYSQARIIVLGLELAKEDISEPLDFFLRENNVRSDILIAVAENEAYKIVTANLGSSLPDAVIIEDALNYGNRNGFCPNIELYKFMNLALSETDTAFCPIIGLKSAADPELEETNIIGTAFFNKSSLSFTADEELTRGSMFLTDDIKKTSFTAEGNEGIYTLEVISSKTKTEINIKENGFYFKINVDLKCDITEFLSGGFNKIGEAQTQDAEAAGKSYIKKLITKSFNEIYTENHADICRFYRRVLLKSPSNADLFYQNMFSDLVNTEINVNLTIRGTGKENF